MMRSATVFGIVASALLTSSLAAELKVVNFENLQQKPRNRISSVKFIQGQGRATTNQVVLSNQKTLYAINITVGTPIQNISVQIDTGSSDLWFPITGSTLCNLKSSACDKYGSYDPTSTSLKDLGQTFSISYADGTKIKGTFVTDNVQIGTASLQSVQFAACNTGSSNTGLQGLLGVGYESNEATTNTNGSTYPNLLTSMVKQGAINTLAYSMWLNDPDSAAGNVLFGGVDSAKYSGNLISMPVVPDTAGAYTKLSMPLTGISFSASGQNFTFTTNTFMSPALIDSGTTLMLFSDDIANALYTSLGVTTKSQIPMLPCSYGNDPSAKMTFTFNGANGAKIDVLLANLLATIDYKLSNGQQACEFLVRGGQPSGVILLGDSFMRSAYLVYDLQNNKIAIAQAKFNETTSNVKEINSDGIPGASVMSQIVGGAAVPTAATSVRPGADPTASTSGGAGGGLETTAAVPTFQITATAAGQPAFTKNAAPLSAGRVPAMSIFGVAAGTLTLLSVFGGALILWV